MKKFSTAKILSLVFVCVMLLGAFAITAFAAEDENVEIVSANLYHGGTYQLMFAVDAPEGATLKAVDSEGNEINVLPYGTKEINEVMCKTYILEKGVAAQAIDEVITFTVEYNGKKAVKNVSVLQYVYVYTNQLKNKEDADEKDLAELAMYEALIAYAVKADAFFNGVTENSFDKYQYVSATGVTVNGIAPTGMYAPGVAPFASIDAIEYDAEKYDLVITVNGETKTLDELKALVVGDTKIDVVVEIVEKAHEHSYTSVVTDPTCIAAGYTTYTCECGDSYTEPGEPATGHSYTDGVCGVCGENDPDYAVEMTIAEALAAELGTKVIVSGTVCEINTPWNDNYGNISVYITDGENKILCYRMGTNVVKGDIITVTGDITEFNGANQIVNGTAVINGHDDSYDVSASEVTIGEALELADGTDVIVTGVVVNIGTPWSDSYGNISVTIKDENGDELYLYRLATNVALNDIIKVTGSMATYKGARQVGEGATADIIGTHECTEFTDATCLELSACVICGATKGELADHDYVDGVCSVCGHVEGAAEVTYATEKFAIAANKGVLSGKTISWASDNFNFLGEQDGSTSAIRTSDTDHFRIYAKSKFTISGNNGQQITKIVVKCTSSSYATALVNSLATTEGVTAVADGTSVTITADTTVTSISFNASAQTRVSSFEITYVA